MAERPPPPGSPEGGADGARPPVALPARYRFEAALGEGGLGIVVRAYDTQLRTPVAIKTIRHGCSTQNPWEYDALRDRFEREAIAGARPTVRNSPYVVTVYDLVLDNDGNAFLVLEYVPGGTLRDRLVGGPLPPDAALRLIADAARGLLVLHEADLVHRDIKPENIFIAADGRAVVGDLGIVQMSSTTFRTRVDSGSAQGHPGTPLYMSPEQANTTDFLTAEADQYSLGAVLFELVTGRRYKQIYAREREALLAGLAALIRRKTTEDPAERYPGMAALLEAIAATDPREPPRPVEQETMPAPAPSPPAPYPVAVPKPAPPWSAPLPQPIPPWHAPPRRPDTTKRRRRRAVIAETAIALAALIVFIGVVLHFDPYYANRGYFQPVTHTLYPIEVTAIFGVAVLAPVLALLWAGRHMGAGPRLVIGAAPCIVCDTTTIVNVPLALAIMTVSAALLVIVALVMSKGAPRYDRRLAILTVIEAPLATFAVLVAHRDTFDFQSGGNLKAAVPGALVAIIVAILLARTSLPTRRGALLGVVGVIVAAGITLQPLRGSGYHLQPIPTQELFIIMLGVINVGLVALMLGHRRAAPRTSQAGDGRAL